MKSNISLEYAEALFTLGLEEKKDKEQLDELLLIRQVIKDNEEYIQLLLSPNLPRDEKIGLIDSAFSCRVSDYVLSFLKLLCEKGRIELLEECIDNYEKLYNQINSVIKARVVSAVSLTDEEKNKIIEKLQQKTKHKVELMCTVDPSILGGIVIHTDDAVIDGSLRRKMHDVKEVINGESKA